MTSVVHYDDRLVGDNHSEFHAHPEFGRPVSYKFRRESGFLGSGFLTGALLVIFLMYYRGGGWEALRPITSLFDFSTQPSEYGPIGGGGQTSPPRSSTSSNLLRVVGSNANLRACPGLDCEVITSLQMGTTVTDLRERETRDAVEWLRVGAGGTEGWVARSLLQVTGAAGSDSSFGQPPPRSNTGPTTLRVRVSGLRMRECPGYNCAEIESLPYGTTITYLGQESIVDSERWYKIRYRSLDGWVSRQDLE
ncbi:MAG: SH3 domain-containing protein [Acidobacteria bacterium]|nr:SH3 domain-containing protein [Acidobacteriota bacterium]